MKKKEGVSESLKAGHVVELPSVSTIADGTAVKCPGEKIFPYIQENVDDIIIVEDSELIVAFLDMVENHKMIVENSGLLTVAALKYMDVKKKKIVSVLSGGNMDVITMASIVQHGLIQRESGKEGLQNGNTILDMRIWKSFLRLYVFHVSLALCGVQ